MKLSKWREIRNNHYVVHNETYFVHLTKICALRNRVNTRIKVCYLWTELDNENGYDTISFRLVEVGLYGSREIHVGPHEIRSIEHCGKRIRVKRRHEGVNQRNARMAERTK